MNGSYKSTFGSYVCSHSFTCVTIIVEQGFDGCVEGLFVDILVGATSRLLVFFIKGEYFRSKNLHNSKQHVLSFAVMYKKTTTRGLQLLRHLHGPQNDTSLGMNELKRNDDHEFNNMELISYMELGGTMYYSRCRDSYIYANGRVKLLYMYRRLMNINSLTNLRTVPTACTPTDEYAKSHKNCHSSKQRMKALDIFYDLK